MDLAEVLIAAVIVLALVVVALFVKMVALRAEICALYELLAASKEAVQEQNKSNALSIERC